MDNCFPRSQEHSMYTHLRPQPRWVRKMVKVLHHHPVRFEVRKMPESDPKHFGLHMWSPKKKDLEFRLSAGSKVNPKKKLKLIITAIDLPSSVARSPAATAPRRHGHHVDSDHVEHHRACLSANAGGGCQVAQRSRSAQGLPGHAAPLVRGRRGRGRAEPGTAEERRQPLVDGARLYMGP